MVGISACDVRDGEQLYTPDIYMDIYGAVLYYEVLGNGKACVMQYIVEYCLAFLSEKYPTRKFTVASLAYVWVSPPCDTYCVIAAEHKWFRDWGATPISDPRPMTGAAGWRARVSDAVIAALLRAMQRFRLIVSQARRQLV